MTAPWSWCMPNSEEHSAKFATGPMEDGRTKQGQSDDGNINVIMANYGKTGVFANLNPRQPTWGDNSKSRDLLEAIMFAREEQEKFMELPAEVRALANNDVVTFLDMLSDEGATEALVAAGLPVNKEPAGQQTVTEEPVT